MMQQPVRQTYIYSSLSADPDLAEVVAMFVDEMPSRIATLTGHLDTKNWDGLRHAAHQLKGAAGSYGFGPVTPSAGRVESAVRTGEPEERIREAVMQLVELCNSVRSSTPQ
jgi:histidine phosphotransfer protein HptB